MDKKCFNRIASKIVINDSLDSSPRDIKKKILETILFDYVGNPLTAVEIIKKCKDSHYINLDVYEVEDILSDDKNYINHHTEEAVKYSMRIEFHEKIEAEIEDKSISHYIRLFYSENEDFNEEINIEDFENTIYEFFYYVSNNNLLEFQKITEKDHIISDEVIIASKFSDEKINMINKFLSWSNEGKNKLIFKFSNIGLEYNILVNPDNYDLFNQLNAKNKIFLLDTNILFRLAGLNGGYRKKRIITFLSNCNSSGQELYYTKYTEKEFNNALKYYCSNLDQYRVENTKLFSEYSMHEDFYNFYYEWRLKNKNLSADVFMAYVKNELTENLNKYNIKRMPTILDEENPEIENKILNLSKKIEHYKKRYDEGDDYSIYTPINTVYDSKNILLIDTLRGEENETFLDTQYFMISTDHKLMAWDRQRNDSIPNIILPSQWLAISLRFLTNSDEDFKCFINFINLPNHKNTISNRDLSIIISAIQSIEESNVAQEILLKGIIEIKIDKILSSSKPEKIYERTIKSAAQIRENLLTMKEKELNNKNINLHESNKEKNLLILENENIKKEKNELEEVVNRYIESEKIKKIKKSMKLWYLPGYISLFVGLFLISFILFEFILHDKNWNIAYKWIMYIESIKEQSLKANAVEINNLILTLVGLPAIYWGITRLFHKEKASIAKKRIEEKISS